MASTKLKLESGIQLLTRLIKKPCIEGFYPELFENGPKPGDFIEIYSEGSSSCLLADMICQSLIINEINGVEAGVIIFNSDGKITTDYLFTLAKTKLLYHIENKTDKTVKYDEEFLYNSMLEKLFVIDVFDTVQFYTSILNLENILMKNPNISMIVFDTLTAFYWDEQTYKVTKMDIYLKKLIRTIQKVIKDFKVTVIYSRPDFFSSSKECFENLEPCCENFMFEQINYRLQILFHDNGFHQIKVRTYEKLFTKMFNIINDQIIWL